MGGGQEASGADAGGGRCGRGAWGGGLWGCIFLVMVSLESGFSKYNFSEPEMAGVYLGLGVGFMLGLVIFGGLSDRVAERLARK